ncbi:MAG: hypothetical protein EOO87_01675 [Pedobacter sp.]|nr:MAG: hypothetical protein EOO87_01675 [Pedobacter sp.]
MDTIFPLGKQGMTQCPHCKQTLSERELSPQNRSQLNIQKSAVKTPLTHFSGLILIGGLILLIVVLTAFDKTGRYIRNPQIGDIYQVKDHTEGRFTFMKVTAVEGDTLVFATHIRHDFLQADINEKAVFEEYDKGFLHSNLKMSKSNIKSMTENAKNLVEIFRK